MVQLAQEERRTTQAISDLVVNSRVAANNTTSASPGTLANAPKGVQLRQVARAVPGVGYATISRATRQRYSAIVGAAQGRPISEIQQDINASMAEFEMPAGYSWDWSYAMKNQGNEFRKLGFAAILAVALIYMLLCIQFENLIVPLSILLSVPLCSLGIFLALFLTGTPFSVMAGVGCLMLIGIAVKNGILLIENTLQAQDRGMPREEALLFACPERLRPILITALAAILGMIPIATRGRGGELEAPMAIAVIGGLLASTLLTLFVVPLAYITLDNFERRWFKKNDA